MPHGGGHREVLFFRSLRAFLQVFFSALFLRAQARPRTVAGPGGVAFSPPGTASGRSSSSCFNCARRL
jgi:hypothetical protein